MLKLGLPFNILSYAIQPPSGGCVLKRKQYQQWLEYIGPAAFRRLCVETMLAVSPPPPLEPAAFRRLCVETISEQFLAEEGGPAAFRRLCVETN